MMLQNYIRIAFRNIFRNSFYSLINVTGLAVGITATALILLFVSHEYSFDRFHKNEKDIYRILARITWGGEETHSNGLSPAFGPRLKENAPEIVDFVRTKTANHILVQSDADHRFFESQFLFADPSLFRVFSFHLLRGSLSSFEKVNTVLLTEETSRKYFGSEDPIGKTIIYDKDNLFEVTGIVEKAPSNSSIQFDFISSFQSLGTIASEKRQFDHENVSLGSYITYLQLQPEIPPAKVEHIIQKIASTSADENYSLESLTSIHTANNSGDSNKRNTTIFIFIAVLILLLALVNYINLTTACSAQRAKEVGIRKTIGANRSSLAYQFYLESALLTIIAFGLSLFLIKLLTPVFLNALQQNIDLAFLRSTVFLTLMTSLFVICILLSGGYPAFVLSQFKPVLVLKGKSSKHGGSSWMRNGFTTFQLSVSIALLFCSLVIQDQLEFMRTKKTGLDKEQVLAIPFKDEVNIHTIKNDIRNQASVTSVGVASFSLYQSENTSAVYTKAPKTNQDVLINIVKVDEEFINTLGIAWVKKENDSIRVGDYIMNESAIEKLEMTEADLGTKLKLLRDSSTLKAIVKDFNYASVQQKIGGLVLVIEPDTAPTLTSNGGTLYVRFDSKSSVSDGVSAIKKIYESHQSDSPFQYYFLDDAYDKLYKGEDRLLLVFKAFTGIGVFIACLGLFGLVTFSTERRTKEIGIRKVLGASINSILHLLSTEYFLLIGVSLLIASPVAWWSMSQWLTNFNYRIDLSIVFVVYAGATAFFVAMATIGFSAIKAAVSNPVNALRNE